MNAATLIEISLSALVLIFLTWKLVKADSSGAAAFKVWFGGAQAAFINGFLSSLAVGAGSGSILSFGDGSASDAVSHADFFHFLKVAGHLLAYPIGNGLVEIKNYNKTNPFPNLFQKTPPAAAALLLLLLLPLAGCASAFNGIAASALPVGHFSKVSLKTGGSTIQAEDVTNDGKTLTYGSIHAVILTPTGITELTATK